MISELTDEKEWFGFVNENKDSTIFHTVGWKNIIQKTFGYKPHYLISKKSDSINGVFPMFQVNSFIFGKRFVSLPFAFSGDPLYDNENTLIELLETAKERSAGSKYLEIRTKKLLPKNIIEQFNLNETLETYLSILELKNRETVWNELSSKYRNNIRKARKNGLKIKELTNPRDLKTFYKLKVELSAKKYGIPCEPLYFYKNLWEEFSSENKIKIFFVEFENKIIAGVVLLMHKDVIYDFSSTADTNYLNLKPYYLLIWEAIKYGCENNYKYFNFGTSMHKGLLDFKEGWGAKSFKIPIYSTEKVKQTETYSIFTKIWKKIPICLSKDIGAVLVRHKGG